MGEHVWAALFGGNMERFPLLQAQHPWWLPTGSLADCKLQADSGWAGLILPAGKHCCLPHQTRFLLPQT